MTLQTANAKNNAHSVNVEKRIARPQTEVFRAISEGRLFFNCSASQQKSRIDFRIGGKYEIQWPQYGFQNQGEFTEIVPHSRIAFTWTQNPTENKTPDTQVTIDLVAEGAATLIKLRHTGFHDQESADEHEGGWTAGITDLGQEMVEGRLVIVRPYPASPAKLYELFKNPAAFFAHMGDAARAKVDFRVGGRFEVPSEHDKVCGVFTTLEPGKKIVFTWENACGDTLTVPSHVTIDIEADDDDADKAWLTLTHDGLNTESLQKSHREGWDGILLALTQ